MLVAKCCPARFKVPCDKECRRKVRIPEKGTPIFPNDPRDGKKCKFYLPKVPRQPVVILSKKGTYFVLFGVKHSRARLLKTDGSLMPDDQCPPISWSFNVVKKLVHKEFNGHFYFSTKIGIFSQTTGKKVKHKAIIAMFEEEAK